MRKLFLIAAFLLAGISVYSQYYLNKRQSLGYLATVYTGLYPTDSCLYIKGVMTDSLYRAGTFLSKFDLNGELIWKSEYTDTTAEYSSWISKIVKNHVGNFVFTGYKAVHTASESQFRGTIFEYYPNGELLRSVEFDSPYLPFGKGFIVPMTLIQADNGDYLIGGNIDDEPDFPGGGFVARFDTLFSLKWMKTFGGIHSDICSSLIETNEGDIIAGGNEFDAFLWHDLTNRHALFAFDSAGQQEQWSWSYPEVFIPEGGSVFWDMLLQPDGSIVAATSITREHYVNVDVNFIVEYPALIKLNPDRTIAWTNRMGNQYFSLGISHLRRVVQAINGTGFVAAGNADAFATDTTQVYHTLGVIQQVSETGDSVWLSYLYYPINGQIPEHEIFDMAPAADQSGYWLCGQARKSVTGQPGQQGWLLFVDQYGCAVPGCRTVSTAEGTPLADKILIYPNPASDYAAIWHSGHTFSKGQFRIVNEQGQLMQAWTAPVDELTTMIDVSGYTPGVYVLVYEDAGGAVTSKQFVVVR